MTPHPRAECSITVDGVNIDQAIRPRIMRIEHTDNRGFDADEVRIELDDSDGKLDLPSKGAILTLSLGWAGSALVPKGEFTVDEIEHAGTPDVLSIHARSGDIADGMNVQRERTWHDTTLGAIVTTIASEIGLTAAVHPSLNNLPVDHLDQTNESAVNLLTRLAQMHDAIATIKSGKLLFTPAAAAQSASGKAIPRITITRQSGDRHKFQIADRQTYTAVRTLYYDVGQAKRGEVIWGKTEDAAERKSTPATQSAPTGQYKQIAGTQASRMKAERVAKKAWKSLKANKAQLAAYIGVKVDYNDKNLKVAASYTYGKADEIKKRANAANTARKDAEKLAGTTESINAFQHSADSLKTLRHTYASQENAKRAARAEWRRLQRGMASFSITLAKAIPELYPEIPVTVSGWKPQIDSTDWIITKVSNTLDAEGGYSQSIEFEIKATELAE